jgi:outer membrane protein assembly factor BamB
VPWLPKRLPRPPRLVWEKTLFSKGVGGVAATREFVLVSGRELDDTLDAFYCLRADTGKEVWSFRYPALGQLDFGNSPRATPLLDSGLVFFFGAFGHLHCVELATGKVLWDRAVREDFGAKDERKWGMCSSPLLVDGKLIVNPGAPEASLVALEPRTGKVLWKAPGRPASYGSLLAGTFGGKRQIVGFDADSLGGWDVANGQRLWRLVLDHPSNFNVPTPIAVGPFLLVAVDNNGTTLFRFIKTGAIDPKPVAAYAELSPDTHTPVAAGRRIFGICQGLHCLDWQAGLKPLWTGEDKAFDTYASLMASEDRLLVTTLDGELLLVDATSDKLQILDRVMAFPREQGGYSHPALVGKRLYIRGESSIRCLSLE